jgi:hypothetical protein
MSLRFFLHVSEARQQSQTVVVIVPSDVTDMLILKMIRKRAHILEASIKNK